MEQFSLPGPADLPWVDEQIARLQRQVEAASAPRNTPSLPRVSNQPTKGPPLTREITDAFTVCWAFFTKGERVVDAPLIGDTLMRQRFAAFLSQWWVYLDDNTRNWIVLTPAYWEDICSKWQTAGPFRQKELRDFFFDNFMWFENALVTSERRSDPSG